MTENTDEDYLITDATYHTDTKKAFYPNIKSTFFLIVVLLFYMVVVTILTRIILNPEHLYSPVFRLLLYSLPLLLTINYTIRKSKKLQGYPIKVSFNKINVWLVPLLVIGAMTLIIPLQFSTSWLPMPDSIRKFFAKAFTKDYFSIFTVTIAAPLLEEILCRGLILEGLLKNYTPLKAILFSALFFSIVHLNPWQAIPAFFSGLFLGWIYYKTHSVIPGMIVHATINIVATIFLFLPRQQSLLRQIGLPYYLLALIISLLVFTSICIFIHKKVQVIQEPLL